MTTTRFDNPTRAAIAERAESLANEAMHMVALQRRRLRSTEPEDETFVFRYWADLQFLVVSLQRLRKAATLAAESSPQSPKVGAAISAFDAALPSLAKLRNVGEHIDDYALDRGHDSGVQRRQLQVGKWDGTTFTWLGESLNVDEAFTAAEQLQLEVRQSGADLGAGTP